MNQTQPVGHGIWLRKLHLALIVNSTYLEEQDLFCLPTFKPTVPFSASQA